VNPSDYIPHLVIYATFNIFAACGLVALLAVTLLVQGPSANSSLVNLEIIFIISSSTSSVLIWTGHARDPHPPFALCLLSASATISNTPLMAGAALALVAKVWGTAMGIWHPQYRLLCGWITCTPVLLLFPFISAIPLFIASIVLGLEHRDQVFRGSPFYCLVNSEAPQSASSILGATYTFISLVLAVWTSIKLIRTQQRAERGRSTEDPGSISFVFAIRVLLFSLFVGAAFVSGIVALTSTFDAVIPDMVVASCGVGAFFIFASTKPILRFVFCQRESRRKNPIPIPSTVTGLSGIWGSGPTTRHGHEFTLSSVTVTRIRTSSTMPVDESSGLSLKQPFGPGVSEGQIQVTRVVETYDENGEYWS
ncbi:hypothetical protein B0H14DRAFT_3720303, partial [Mycena olivaceomarginata]